MASVVLAARNKVNFSHTQQPIVFGHVTIERNIKARRNLIVDEEELIEPANSGVCCYCSNPALWRCVTTFSVSPVKFVCRSHLFEMERRHEVVSKERV